MPAPAPRRNTSSVTVDCCGCGMICSFAFGPASCALVIGFKTSASKTPESFQGRIRIRMEFVRFVLLIEVRALKERTSIYLKTGVIQLKGVQHLFAQKVESHPRQRLCQNQNEIHRLRRFRRFNFRKVELVCFSKRNLRNRRNLWMIVLFLFDRFEAGRSLCEYASPRIESLCH